MRNCSASRLFCFLFLVLLGLLQPLRADDLNNNEVSFTGTISSVVVNGEGVGTIFIRLQDFDLRVAVNSDAELLDQAGDDIALADLAAGDSVEIRGKFSASGILSTQIRRLADANKDFQLKGHITAIQTSGGNTLVSLLGITITVTADTKIEQDGAKLTASDLKVGMLISAQGTISGSTWTATSIKVSSEIKKEKVTFEGTVTEYATDKIKVAVSGTTTNTTTVLITSNTRIVGDLKKGALVSVKGTLNADLSVTAREIRVLKAIEIKPDERKIKVGETATFTVKLRESAASDVVVTLKSSDTTIVTVSASSVTILKGSKTADFTAKGIKLGSADITAEALGHTATAKVTVGDVSDEDNDKSAGQTSISFAPNHISMGLNETRDVVLLIKPPQKDTVSVKLTVKNALVTVAGSTDFSNGAASLKVTIQSSTKVGTDSVIATLPTSLGGGKAELLVEVSAKGGENENAEIEFRPDHVTLSVGDTRSVNLQLKQTLSKDVTVALKSSSAAVEVASSVVIPAGSKMVSISVKGKSEGKGTVEAALPQPNGGGKTTLEVEVKKN